MSNSRPIETVSLFPELSRRFSALLDTLDNDDWKAPVSPAWRVRDVVAHLLDSSIRRLSAQRDAHMVATAPVNTDYTTLLAHLSQMNADWVRALERVSPKILADLIRWSDAQLYALFASLDPAGVAIWPVAWAGEAQSENWFDIAREYTEKWHHAQQVFEATGRPSTISDRDLMHPCLDTLMRGLPHGLRDCAAPDGTRVRVRVSGDAGDGWLLQRAHGQWRLCDPEPGESATTVTMDQNDAWKVLMKRLNADEARARFKSINVEGNQHYGNAVLETVCVMA